MTETATTRRITIKDTDGGVELLDTGLTLGGFPSRGAAVRWVDAWSSKPGGVGGTWEPDGSFVYQPRSIT